MTKAVKLFSCDVQNVTTDRTVAWAEFVSLKSVQNAQCVLRVAANVQVRDIDVLDFVVWIHNIGRTIRNPLFLVANAEAINQ